METQYEAVIAFTTDLDEAAVQSQIEKIQGIVRAHGGELSRQDTWGRREFGFRIEKKTSGIYVLLMFSGDNTVVADLDRQLKINEAVLRHMVVKKDKHAPDMAPGGHPDDSFSAALADSIGDFDDGSSPSSDL